jgi:hypothetical protein
MIRNKEAKHVAATTRLAERTLITQPRTFLVLAPHQCEITPLAANGMSGDDGKAPEVR